jgi:hypothetical protein
MPSCEKLPSLLFVEIRIYVNELMKTFLNLWRCAPVPPEFRVWFYTICTLVGSSDVPSSNSFPSSVIRSDQADSTGKPTGDVVENFGAAVRKLEDIFVRVAMHHISACQIVRPKERNLRCNLATLGQLVRTDEGDFEHHLTQARDGDRLRAWPPSKVIR